MVNLNEFTRFGIEWKRGDYKKLNKHSVEYRLLWQEQLNRCYNGHSIGGEYISGFLYWYVNFGSIELLRDDGKGKHKGTPLLRDIEVIIDKEVRQCQTEGINLMLMTGRRGGKSYWGSGMASHNAIFHSDKSLICAFDTDKRDNMMKMCQTHLNGMLETEFFIPILKGTYQSDLILGYAKRDPETKKYIDTFTGGVIHSRIFKNNKTAANGLSARVAIFEEVGMFNNLIESYNATKYCWMDGGKQFGFALLVGTGGDMEKGSIDAAKMFEDPEAYDLKVFEDPENPQKKTGLFIPAQFTLNDFKDDHGNTDLLKSTEYLTGVREKLKKARNINTLYEEIQYRPMRWQEVFLKSSGNIFNAALIQDQINKISMDRTLQNIGTRGMLEWAGGYTRFVPDDNLREVEFPINKHKENKGCVTIYEHPFEEVKGDYRTIPFGLYLAGTDPYQQDQASSSVSVGSTFIYKRIIGLDKTYDVIVAEYTGRPLRSDDYFDTVRKLLIYYNAKCLYENNIPTMKAYFEQKQCLHLLAKQPNILKDILEVSGVERGYGVHMTQKVKMYLVDTISNWINTERGDGIYNIHHVYSMELLKELLNYNFEDNFDRVIAFGMCLLKDQEEYKNKVQDNDSRELHEKFFSPMFSRAGFDSNKYKPKHGY